MNQNWLQKVSYLPLTPSEREIISKFKDQPYHRMFLGVAEILLKYGIHDEAIQLLAHGIEIHPGYTPARIVLAKELFKQGMPLEAWQTLEKSLTPLKENKAAQILSLKLALVLGYEDLVPVIRQNLAYRDFLEGELIEISDQLLVESFDEVRKKYIMRLRAEGIPLPSSLGHEIDHGKEPTSPKSRTEEVIATKKSQHQESLTLKRRIEGFFVTPLNQIFPKAIKSVPGLGAKDMDAITLAQVYRRQGQYKKSLEILKRLLYMAPHNEMLQKQCAELRSLFEEQKRRERDYDPELADRMEQVSSLDKQIQNLSVLLEELNHYEVKNL